MASSINLRKSVRSAISAFLDYRTRMTRIVWMFTDKSTLQIIISTIVDRGEYVEERFYGIINKSAKISQISDISVPSP